MSKPCPRKIMSVRQILGLGLIVIFLASVTTSEGMARPNVESSNFDIQMFASVLASTNTTETKTKHVTSEQTLTTNSTASSKSSQKSTTVTWPSTVNSSRSAANYSLTSYSPFQQSTTTSVVNASSKVSQLTTNISYTGPVSTTYTSSSTRLSTTVKPTSTTFVSSSRTVRISSYTTQSSRSVTVTRRVSTVTTTWRESYPRGTTRALLDASPKPAFINTPVTITGTLYGSWHPLPIKDGMVTDKPVEISADWGFSTVVNTDYYGRFTVVTAAPPTSGLYNITVTFYEDQDLEGCSTAIQYQVVETIETTLWLSYMPIQQGMGSATKFYGMLQEKNSGRPVPGKTILLTVMGGGSSWTYTLTTDSNGYYELIYTNNNGIFNWAEARFNGDALYLPSYSGRIVRQG